MKRKNVQVKMSKAQWEKKLRMAYIRGMINLSVFLMTMGCYVYFGIYTLEKYFM